MLFYTSPSCSLHPRQGRDSSPLLACFSVYHHPSLNSAISQSISDEHAFTTFSLWISPVCPQSRMKEYEGGGGRRKDMDDHEHGSSSSYSSFRVASVEKERRSKRKFDNHGARVGGGGGICTESGRTRSGCSWKGKETLPVRLKNENKRSRLVLLDDPDSESEGNVGSDEIGVASDADLNALDNNTDYSEGKRNHANGRGGESNLSGGAVMRIRSDEPTKYMFVRRNQDVSLKVEESDEEDIDITLRSFKRGPLKGSIRSRGTVVKQENNEMNVSTVKHTAIVSAAKDDICYKKRKHVIVEESCTYKTERSNMMLSSDRRSSRISGGCGDQLLGLNERWSPDFSCKDEVIRVQGKGGVLRVLRTNKKMGGLEEASFTPSHPSSSRDRKLQSKTPPSAFYKSKIDKERVIKDRYCSDKTEMSDLGPTETQPKNTGGFNGEGDVTNRKKNIKSVLKPSSTAGSRATEKQKLRNQIKDIILNAGWKIELKPRKNRNYEDSIYVSPQGTGYWSITKAYAVFLEQSGGTNAITNSNDEEQSGKLSQLSHRNSKNLSGSNSFSYPIPDHVISILKRNVVNKRSKKNVHDESGKECGQTGRTKMRRDAMSGKKSKKNAYCNASSISLRSSSHSGGKSPKRRKKNQRGCKLLVRRSHPEASSDADEYNLYDGKRTLLTWMIEAGAVVENGIVNYMGKRKVRSLLKGNITRDGIRCHCCSKTFSVPQFEVHAGSKLGQPYRNIFLEETGLSLFQCLVVAWDNQEESDRSGFSFVDVNGDDSNDDTCGICGDGGDLICCDGCPSTYHLCCLGIKMLPPGDWLCSNCTCRFCGKAANENSLDSTCFSDQMLSCNQCEKKYHKCCIPETEDFSDHSTSYSSFCGTSCKKIFEQLQKLLGVKNMLEDGFSWSLVQRIDLDLLASPPTHVEITECNAKAAVALSVLDECFLPITDQRSGVNIIHNIVYNCGSNFNRLNYCGFYTFLLEKEDEIISAASIRIHGTRFAEMPFIGTRDIYRHQGMCRRLLNAIQMALSSLDVAKLVIPAISELLHTWTTVFDFKPVDHLSRQELKSRNLLVFPGTGLLEKSLTKQDKCQPIIGDRKVAETERDMDLLKIANRSAKVEHDAKESISRDSFETKDGIVDSKTNSHISNGLAFTNSEVVIGCSGTPCDSDLRALQCQQNENTFEMEYSLDSDGINQAPGLDKESNGRLYPSCQIRSFHGDINPNQNQFKTLASSFGPNKSSLQSEYMCGLPERSILSSEVVNNPSHESVSLDSCNVDSEVGVPAPDNHSLNEKSINHPGEVILQNSGANESHACCT